MTMSEGRFTVVSLTALSLIGALVGPLVHPATASTAVGLTASAGTRVDGVRVPSGTTLLSPALVETGDRGAVIHLSNGQVVALSEGAAALVESTDTGAIQLSMHTGKMAYADASGEVTTVSSNNRVVLDPSGQVTEEASTGPTLSASDQNERLCQLQDSTPTRFDQCSDPESKNDDGCDWEYLEVPMEEVSQYLDIDSVLACEDRNALDLDCDCDLEAGGYMWWVVGGIGAAAAVGIIITDNDKETVASPTTP